MSCCHAAIISVLASADGNRYVLVDTHRFTMAAAAAAAVAAVVAVMQYVIAQLCTVHQLLCALMWLLQSG
jgi:hypothetical protein